MRYLKEKLDLLLSRYSLYLLLAFCAVLVFSLTGNFKKVIEANRKVDEIEKRIENLKEENNYLEKDLEMAKGEEFMEKNLRDELGYVKKGEIVIVLPEDEDYIRSFAPKLPQEENLLPDPNWKKWAKLFI